MSFSTDLVIMFFLELQLAVELRHRVEDLGKVCALEDPEHGGDDGVAEDAAQVGVHRHLKVH